MLFVASPINIMKIPSRVTPVAASLLLLANLSLTSALPQPASQASVVLVDNTNASINTNNTADCTNCTNLGNFNNPLPVLDSDPTVKVKNGSYAGVSISPIPASATLSGYGTNHSVEAFLGIPYSQQPVGARRFARPVPLNESWDEVRSAKRYSEHCFGVGTDNDYNPPYVTYKLGEECLTLNVVRPSGVDEQAKLPVFVWIHGGGFLYGGSGDIRYNGSFIVDQSVALNQPILFVSLNYRTSLLGFPTGDAAKQAGIENLGLYDQRLALAWIHENIHAFGGDKSKVTIVGESAGGASIFHHLTAYSGRDDKLFRAAIAQSGYYSTTPLTPNTTESRNQAWQSLLDYTNCSGSSSLDCLRSLPLDTIKQWSVDNSDQIGLCNPVVDEDMVAQDMQKSFLEGKFVDNVSVILNANLDEGISFGVRNLNTTQDIIRALKASNELPDSALTEQAQRDLARIYPDNEDIYPPFQAGAGLLPGRSGGASGAMDRRSCAVFGDLQFIGPKRQAAELLARKSSAPIYNSRFDQVSYKSLIVGGAQHFQEVAYVFRNPLDSQNALGPKEADKTLAELMSSSWISFVASGNDPNVASNDDRSGSTAAKAPFWPKYVPDGDRSSIAWVNNGLGEKTRIIPDNYRRQGIKLLLALRGGSYSHDDFETTKAKRDEL